MEANAVTQPAILHCPIKEFAPLPAYDLQEITPLIAHLQNGNGVTEETVFPRGTLLPDGRLDLCKQSLGVGGCQLITQALKDYLHVKALLLGTNGIGDEGASQVAQLIEKNPHLEVVYLGCNQIGAEGAQAIATVMKSNKTVRGLWLKRNPIGDEGTQSIAEMLRQNETLQTLDLVNTQFGETGFRALLEVLKNDNRTLQRLYLGSSGITSRGAQMLADMLRINRNLKALLLNVNHIGDEGAIFLADALNENESLEELGLASNGISFLGIEALLKAAGQHPRLRFLDLGYSRSTKALGAKPNQLIDTDVLRIAALLQANSALRHLDLRGTGLGEEGKTHLAQALQDNQTLCELHLPGKRPDELTKILRRNREKTPETEQLSHPKPLDVALIKSVYRTV